MLRASALLIVSLLSVEPSPYEIDPQHLTVAFLVEHVGFAKVLGRFRDAEGRFTFDEDKGEIADVRVDVRTASVDTSVEPRDRHLRSADFLNVEKFPEMVFESMDVTRLEEGRGKLHGTLTLLGVARPVALSVEWNRSGTSPLPGNPYVAGFSARGRFLRSEFGMTYGVGDGLVGDEVELLIELEAHRR